MASLSSSKSDPSVSLFGECVSLLVTCARHLKLALCPLPSNTSPANLWFPFVRVKPGQSLTECVHILLHNLFPCLSFLNEPIRLLQETRFQLDKSHSFNTITLFGISLESNESCLCSTAGLSESTVWWHYSEIGTKSAVLAGPEPIVYANRLLSNEHIRYTITEHSIKSIALWLTDQSSPTSELVRTTLGTTFEDDIARLYSDFVQHCFPSLTMNYHKFQEFTILSGLTLSNLPNIFKALNKDGENFLEFNQFLIGLAVMEPKVEAYKKIMALRAEYIYRYYNSSTSSNNSLSFDDFTKFATNLNKNKSTSSNAIASLYCEAFPSLPPNSPIPKQTFIEALSSGTIKSVDSLFRSRQSPIECLLKCKSIYPIERHRHNKTEKRLYQLSRTYINIDPDGTFTDEQSLPYEIEIVNKEDHQPKVDSLVGTQENDNKFYFDFFQMIRSFIASPETSLEWPNNRENMMEDILKLCKEAQKLFTSEPRIVRISSPCYVFGDIHGSAHDIANYDAIFWRIGPNTLTDNFLLLGDFVDRGDYSVECICYLFCLKLLAPKRVHLIRGNHETRNVNFSYGFLAELEDKFGEINGSIIQDAFNDAFDVMPPAALIDGQIFCAHGGIPGPVATIADIEAAIPPVHRYKSDSNVTFQLLWNDPIEHYSSFWKRARDPEGFCRNFQRGDGLMFSEEATERFLSLNGLSHVIRAHEPCMAGYKSDFGGRVITVFSSSDYEGMGNKAALALVNNNRTIQIVQIDRQLIDGAIG